MLEQKVQPLPHIALKGPKEHYRNWNNKWMEIACEKTSRKMASGNGPPLRSLMTNLQNLNKIPEAKQLNDYVTTLTNIKVGVPGSRQWEPEESVERWVTCLTHELKRKIQCY